MSNKFKLFLGVLLIAVGVGRFALADVRPMIVGGGTGTTDLTAVNATLSALSTNKMDKADRSCATGYVLKGITASGTTECVAASSASLPTGTEGQVISYDSSGNAVASTVQELAFSATDFNETVSGTTTTVSLASAGGGTISLTESATDPAYSSMTTGQMIVSKSSGDLFYKSATGGYTFAGVYVVDPATYSLTFTLSGVSGADKLTINGADYTAGTTVTGLSGDVAVTGTLGSSTALACTGTGISGDGLSYLASMTEARSMACEFSGASTGGVIANITGTSDSAIEFLSTSAKGQSFTSALSAKLSSIQMTATVLAGTRQVTCRVDDDTDMASEYIEEGTVSVSALGAFSVPFTGANTLNSGTKYYMACKSDYPISVGRSSTDVYAGGNAMYASSGWVMASTTTGDVLMTVNGL